jgi:hypothetical protein
MFGDATLKLLDYSLSVGSVISCENDGLDLNLGVISKD